MTEPVQILFVALPADARATATVRALSAVNIETVTTAADAREQLESVDCVVCSTDIPDTDPVSFFEEVQDSQPTLPCLLFGDGDAGASQEVLDRDLADWVPRAGGGLALANRLKRVAERIHRDRRLEAVRDAFETMTSAETAVETAQSVLDYSAAVVARYTSDEGALRPVAWAGVSDPDDRLFDTESGLAWTSFLKNEARWGEPNSETEGKQWLALPLGRHGVLVVAQESDIDRDERMVMLAKTLAANVESAFARLDREWEVSTRDTALTNAEMALERLRRRESVVRDVLAVLTEARTRTEIEKATCERLTNTDTYRFAWVGEYDAATEDLTPRTWVGDDQSFLDELSMTPIDGAIETTTWTAVQTRELAVDPDLLGEPPYESWRQEALKRGYRSAISVPLIFRGTIYGVLTVYGGEPDSFGTREQLLIEDVGKAVAYARNAIESKRALVSDSTVELEFRVRDSEFTVIEFVQMLDCRFEFESVIREADDTLRLFFTTEKTTPESVLEFSDRSLVINDIRHITSRGDRDLFECSISGANVISLLLDHVCDPESSDCRGCRGQTHRRTTTVDGRAPLRRDLPESLREHGARGTSEAKQADPDGTRLPGEAETPAHRPAVRSTGDRVLEWVLRVAA